MHKACLLSEVGYVPLINFDLLPLLFCWLHVRTLKPAFIHSFIFEEELQVP